MLKKLLIIIAFFSVNQSFAGEKTLDECAASLKNFITNSGDEGHFDSRKQMEDCIQLIANNGGVGDLKMVPVKKSKKAGDHEYIEASKDETNLYELTYKGIRYTSNGTEETENHHVFKKGSNGKFTSNTLSDKKLKIKDRSKKVAKINQDLKRGVHLYCGLKKWTYSKMKEQKQKCESNLSKGYEWVDEPDCECKQKESACTDSKGNKISWSEVEKREKDCQDKKTKVGRKQTTTYVWSGCQCDPINKPNPTCNDGSEEGNQIAGDKELECFSKGKSFDSSACKCVPKEKEKLCNGKYTAEQVSRKEKSCNSKKNSHWYGPSASGLDVNGDKVDECSCVDECYGVEVKPSPSPSPCFKNEPKIGSIDAIDVSQEICGSAVKDLQITEVMFDECMKKLKTFDISKSPKGSPVTINYQISVNETVVCTPPSEKVLEGNGAAERELPYNIPTANLNEYHDACKGYDQYTDCSKAPKLKQCQLKATGKEDGLDTYRMQDGDPKVSKQLTCQEWKNVVAANQEIKDKAKDVVDQIFANSATLKKDQVTTEDLDKMIKDLNFQMDILGTANRSNNSTRYTLDQLASKRRDEARDLMQEEIKKLLDEGIKSKYGMSYSSNPDIKIEKQFIGGFGPLAPYNHYTSMLEVVGEMNAPATLKNKLSGYKKMGLSEDEIKAKLYEDSVNYFFDEECPNLSSNPMGDKINDLCKNYTKDNFLPKEMFDQSNSENKVINAKFAESFRSQEAPIYNMKRFEMGVRVSGPEFKVDEKKEKKGDLKITCSAKIDEHQVWDPNNIQLVDIVTVTKPGVLRRFKKDCREEKKKLVEELGGKENFREATKGGFNSGATQGK